MMTRREALANAVASLGAAAVAKSAPAASGARITPAVLISMLPKETPYRERFRKAIEVGFSQLEMQTVEDDAKAERIRDAAREAGLEIHSVMNMAHWRHPLSSPDPEDVERSVEGMQASLRQAKIYGADAVLLVPAVVRDDTTYEQAWERSQRVIRQRILPVAERTGVTVAIEEVWNKFLLTPGDFVAYIDEFDHPLVKAYFDVGNIVHYGVPQHWIREIGGERLIKLHLKDYSRQAGFVNLGEAGEGGVDWPAVRQALDDIGFEGEATVELRAGDWEYLADLRTRVERLIGPTG